MTRFMPARLLVAAIVAVLLCAAPAGAAGTDRFDQAPLLPYGVADTTTNNAGATIEQGESLTSGGDSADRTHCVYANGTRSQSQRTMWWQIVGTGRPVTVTTAGSMFDTHLGIFDGPINDSSVSCIDSDPTETFTFNSVAGAIYHVQVGSCVSAMGLLSCPNTSGQISVLATSSAAANDTRGAAAALPSGVVVNGDNFAATEEVGENLSCSGLPFGRTVWYLWHAPAAGSVVFTATGFTSLAVYGGLGAPLACDAVVDGQARAAANVIAGGDYLVQVGGTGARAGLAGDSLQGAFTIRGDFTPKPVETRVKARATASYLFYTGYTQITGLRAYNVPAGATIKVTCAGNGCPYRNGPKRTLRRTAAVVRLTSTKLRAAKIKPTTILRVRITAPKKIGREISFRFTKIGRAPTQRTRCISNTTGKFVRC